jgi:dTDP-4-dehydrorhamnose reductase
MYGFPVGKKIGFLQWMRQEAIIKGKVNLFIDQERTPVYIGDVCECLIRLAASDCSGIFHAGGPERVNRVEMGERYLPLAGISVKTINPQRTDEVSFGYRIQKNLSLNSEKIKKELRFSFTGLNEGLALSISHGNTHLS